MHNAHVKFLLPKPLQRRVCTTLFRSLARKNSLNLSRTTAYKDGLLESHLYWLACSRIFLVKFKVLTLLETKHVADDV